jgi:hypothetical protein
VTAPKTSSCAVPPPGAGGRQDVAVEVATIVVFVAALLSVVRDSTGGALLLTIGVAVAGAALLAVTSRSA